MFMGPLSEGGDFSDSAMEGMHRWVGRVWRLIGLSAKNEATRTDDHIRVLLHSLIARMTDDMPKRRYNTAIAAMMEFTNELQDSSAVLSKEDAKLFICCLAPFAPHIAEELWQRMCGRKTMAKKQESIHMQPWPTYDNDLLRNKKIQFVIQVNGKTRAIVEVDPSQSKNQAVMEDAATSDPRVMKFLVTGVKKTIFVSGRLVNFVV